jgi:hypothetical protein
MDLETPAEGYKTALLDPFTGRMTPLPPKEFQQAARLFLFHDAVCIVLCPGDKEPLLNIAQSAGSAWSSTPFVNDTRNLDIINHILPVHSLGLGPGQAAPAILEYDGTNHIVDFGRGYSHVILVDMIVPVITAMYNYYKNSIDKENKSNQTHNIQSHTQSTSYLKL